MCRGGTIILHSHSFSICSQARVWRPPGTYNYTRLENFNTDPKIKPLGLITQTKERNKLYMSKRNIKIQCPVPVIAVSLSQI
jgi:hypothetical protein